MINIDSKNVEKKLYNEIENTGKVAVLTFYAVFNKEKCESCIKEMAELEKKFENTAVFFQYDCTNDYYRMEKYNIVDLPSVYIFNKNGIIDSFPFWNVNTVSDLINKALKKK